MKWKIVLCLLCLCLIPVSLGAKAKQNQVVARADGLEIKMDFVRTLERYYLKQMGHHAAKQELIRSAVEHWLMAREALKSNIPGVDQSLSSNPSTLSVENVVGLRAIYLAHLVHEYPIPERVLRSYYVSFPERFQKEANATTVGKESSDPLKANATKKHSGKIPFSQAKNQIRQWIMQGKMPQVRREAFERLKEKYSVQMIHAAS